MKYSNTSLSCILNGMPECLPISMCTPALPTYSATLTMPPTTDAMLFASTEG